MRIERLFLNDFGCFRQERLEGLAPGLVVIAGPQRAGKTTLLQVLRHLGFGFPRGAALPPAADRYDVAAELLRGGHRYMLRLQGYGEPSLSPLDGAPALSVQDLCAGLTSFSYRQIFTITLDELRRLPEGLDQGDQSELQTVLLGAGWADAARLPHICAELDKEAGKLGGKQGGKARQFRPHLEEIEQALRQKREAAAQVDWYREKQGQLADLNEAIRRGEAELQQQRGQVARLALADRLLPDYQQYRELSARLARPESQELLRTYPARGADRAVDLRGRLAAAWETERIARANMAGLVGEAEVHKRQALLLASREELTRFEGRISGWEAELEAYHRNLRETEMEEASLRARLRDLHPAWSEDLSHLEDIRTDLAGRDEVGRVCEAYTSARQAVESVREQMDQARDELAGGEERLRSLPEPAFSLHCLIAAGAVLVTWGAAVAVAFWAQGWASWGAALAGTLVVLGWLLPRLHRDRLLAREAFAARRDVAEAQADLARLEQRADVLSQALEGTARETDRLRERMGIPPGISAAAMVEFYREARRLKEDLTGLRRRKEGLTGQARDLRARLDQPARVVAGVLGHSTSWDQQGLDGAEAVIGRLRACCAQLRPALEMEKARGEVARLVEEADRFLREAVPEGNWEPTEMIHALDLAAERGRRFAALFAEKEKCDRLRERLAAALESPAWRSALPSDNEQEEEADDPLAVFGRLVQPFRGAEEVKNALQEARRREGELTAQLDQMRHDRARLTVECENLAADSTLMEAHTRLSSARQKLEFLAVRYAELRIALFLLEQLRERFREKAHGPLLRRAGALFQQITGGDYTSIAPLDDDDLTQADFRAFSSAGSTSYRTGQLSRGTREQLFLAVRLARIEEIEPPLPVVLDDSTANFDPLHLERVCRALRHLAESHQVFVLTCHPEMVSATHRLAGDIAQYWWLESGRFSGPASCAEELIARLSGTV